MYTKSLKKYRHTYSNDKVNTGVNKIFVSILMTFFFLPLTARDFTYEGIIYTVIDEESGTCATRSWYDDDDGITRPGNIVSGDIVIPSLVTDEEGKQYKVVKISSSSFEDNIDLITIKLPNTIDNIMYDAFYKCTSLESVNLPDNLEIVWFRAFYDCEKLKKVIFSQCSPLLFDYAFLGCKSLEHIELPDNTHLSGGVFALCSGLRYVKLPKNMTSLGSETFYGCVSLETVIFPESLEYIGDTGIMTGPYHGAFEECTSLKHISFPETLYCIGRNAFVGCTSLETVILPLHIKQIRSDAFEGCSSLQEIIYPTSTPCELEEDKGTDNFPMFNTYGFTDETYENATLIVGLGGKSRASTRAPWKFFKHIEERDFTGVDEIESEPSAGNKEIYRMDGTKAGDSTDALPSGLYIVRENGKSSKVMIP